MTDSARSRAFLASRHTVGGNRAVRLSREIPFGR
jgi:hypothetical protein